MSRSRQTHDRHAGPGAFERASAACAWVMAVLYGALALLAMWRAPRVPYADGWRFLGRFAAVPPGTAVFGPDNGHHEVLPNAVRVLELHVLDAGQQLQVWTGIALLAATVCAIWWQLRCEREPLRRRAQLLAAVVGLCWLGNVRVLGHANESVHAYLVTLCVVLGIGWLARGVRIPAATVAAPGIRDAVPAAALAAIAAFSFGSGLAAFIALFAVAFLRRAGPPVHLVLGGALAATLLLRRIGNAGADAFAPSFAPLAQADLALRWLAAPMVHAAWPLLDPALAARVPTAPLRAVATGIADAWQGAFGPVMLARWPHLLFGAAGVAWLLSMTWRARGSATRPALLGIGLAWFALGVGGLVALGRLRYFELHPDQLLASRYVVWSSLFWAGLGIAAVARARVPVRAAIAVALVALALLPSQLWMWRLGTSLRDAAQRTAVAVAVGVLEPGLETGESVPAEVARALPAIRRAHAAVFAWPETAALGRGIGEAGGIVATDAMTIVPVPNRLGGPGRRVRFRADARQDRLVLVDADRIVRGIALRDPAQEGAWIGWMQGAPRGAVQVRALR